MYVTVLVFVPVLMFVLSMYPWGTTDRTVNSPEEEELPITTHCFLSFRYLFINWDKNYLLKLMALAAFKHTRM